MQPHPSLTRAEEFRRVTRTGRRVTRDGLVINAIPAEDLRVGLAVRARGAVVRNRIKRRLRAAAAEGLAHPVHVVARADAGVASMPFQELVISFRQAAEGAST